jgi:hypothetical protein
MITGPLTTAKAAQHFGVQTWQVRRIYEAGLLPPPDRAGAYRLIKPAELPALEEALRRRGYLPNVVEVGQ